MPERAWVFLCLSVIYLLIFYRIPICLRKGAVFGAFFNAAGYLYGNGVKKDKSEWTEGQTTIYSGRFARF